MKLIDLSHKLTNGTPPYPGDVPLVLEQYRAIEKDKYNAFFLKTGLHTGTHIDIPMHLLEDARTIDTFPLERFMGRAVLLEVCGAQIIRKKAAYDTMVQEGDIVLFHTGHDRYYGEERYFTAQPEIHPELCTFLLERRVKMVGMDMPSPDLLPFTQHRALLRAGVPILENLTNLDALPKAHAFTLMAFPLKLEAEASLVRAVAMVKADSIPQ